MNKLFPVTEEHGVDVSGDEFSDREKILIMEEHMKKLPQLEIKTTHHYAKGIYAREIFIPKGTLLTGKIHKTEHLNIMSQGEITVMTDEGMKRLKAPQTMVSKAGTKRIGYAHEDTVWITIHGTKEVDLKKLEKELIAEDFSEFELDAKDLKELQGG